VYYREAITRFVLKKKKGKKIKKNRELLIFTLLLEKKKKACYVSLSRFDMKQSCLSVVREPKYAFVSCKYIGLISVLYFANVNRCFWFYCKVDNSK